MYIFLFDSMYIIHLMKTFNVCKYFVYKARDWLSLSA